MTHVAFAVEGQTGARPPHGKEVVNERRLRAGLSTQPAPDRRHNRGITRTADLQLRCRWTERDRPQLVKQSLAIGHAAANPCRQLGCAGRHASSRLAFAFDAPRMSVIITTPASPANSRPMNRGTRIGFLAPSS